jgi:hypothetical protein
LFYSHLFLSIYSFVFLLLFLFSFFPSCFLTFSFFKLLSPSVFYFLLFLSWISVPSHSPAVLYVHVSRLLSQFLSTFSCSVAYVFTPCHPILPILTPETW